MKLGYRFILSAPLLFISCSPYQVKHISAPTNLIPNQLEQPDSAKNKKHNNLWWYEFKDPDLVTLIDILLDQNFDLKEAYQRLKQAEAQRTIAVSQQYPQVSLGTGLSRNHSERPGEQITGNPQAPDFRRSVTTLEAGATLQYEIDLWKRLDSLAESAKLQQQASKADLEGVLNTILGQVTNLWFNLKSQSALERLLSQQINTSQHYLDLINLRFQAGISPGLEVLQQKQQLASLLTQLPEIQQNLDLTHSRLATLLGLNKQELVIFPISSHLPVLPSFPDKIDHVGRNKFGKLIPGGGQAVDEFGETARRSFLIRQ